jgi:hypothetical protein
LAVVLLTLVYGRWHALFAGAMAAVVGVICGGAFLLAKPYFAPRRLLRTLVILAAALGAGQIMNPVWVLLLAGACGYLWRDA